MEGKRADLVARIKDAEGESYILHVEIQNDNRANVPLRMLRYYSDIALEYLGEEVVQHLLYIGKAPLTMPDHVRGRNWVYRYEVMDMRSQDSEHFLNSDNPDALVLAILCDPKAREPESLVAYIVSELRRLHGTKLDSLRDSLIMLDILASNRDLQNLVKEHSAMFIDIEKLGLYQLAKEKVMEQGIEQGVQQGIEKSERKIVLKLLTKFPPEQVADFSGIALAKVEAIAAANKPR